MATIKVTNSSSKTGSLENYLKQEHKTQDILMTGKDCDPSNFSRDFEITKLAHDKPDGRQHKHIIQAFAPGEVSPKQAHEIGNEMLKDKYFEGFQAVVVTHVDKDHIHNHIVVNTVNMDTGMKLHQSQQDLKHIKEISNDLCRERGLNEIKLEPSESRFKSMAEIQLDNRGEKTWKSDMTQNIKASIDEISKQGTKLSADDRFSFLQKSLQSKGIEITRGLKESNKTITFKDSQGNKIRGDKLDDKLKNRQEIEKNIKSMAIKRDRSWDMER